MGTQSKAVRRDEFVKRVRDPKSTDPLVKLQGYIGDSDLQGHLRVYFDPALNDFIDLPEQDILHSIAVDTKDDPLGGSHLWVKKTTVFSTGDPRHANRIKSSFLEGDLVKAFGNQGGKIPRGVAKGMDIHSEFVVTGCGPETLQFEDCAPTGSGRPECQVFGSFGLCTFPTDCIKQTCVQPTCQVGCNISRHPYMVCCTAGFAQTCIVAYGGAGQRQAATQPYQGAFNPYGQ